MKSETTTLQAGERTHTSGPWEFSGPHSVVGADTIAFSVYSRRYSGDSLLETSIASVIFMPGEDDIEQCRADARLIAAAPDLLAELQNIAAARPSTWDAEMRDEFQAWAQSRARDAVAKVTKGHEL